MTSLLAVRESDTFNIETDGETSICLIYEELPDHLLQGLFDFIHNYYGSLAVVVDIGEDRDRPRYFISQSGSTLDFAWSVEALNRFTPGCWQQKPDGTIFGDRPLLKVGPVVETIKASQLPADEVAETQSEVQNALPSEKRFFRPGWLRSIAIGAIGFGIGALFSGIL
ncbi:hypothetical protein H6G00_05090 [Leptolyngbya sp. FACHB-541]|uniref:hypothetical protein n=1 Tax=Leptolyngbya sp. FACHB-541 TaxID=2692810 RepID=UPI0016842F78|nr:hypothetical protein [Leptolyngbya sp. FACHB-541]MBD1995991.1 hypothetical protein [Leptolyngbya sp. FACHB-541]